MIKKDLKIKERIVYKCVRKVDNKLRSLANISQHPYYNLEYKIGEEISGKIGKLFVFDTLPNALRHCNVSPNFAILKCKAKGCTIAPIRVPMYPAFVKKFWENNKVTGNFSSSGWNTPAGTLLCETVIPIRIME